MDQYLALVGITARRLAPKLKQHDREDLEGELRIALVRAYRSYRPDSGSQISTWLIGKMRYAGMEWLRSRGPERIGIFREKRIYERFLKDPGSVPAEDREMIKRFRAIRNPMSIETGYTTEDGGSYRAGGEDEVTLEGIPSEDEPVYETALARCRISAVKKAMQEKLTPLQKTCIEDYYLKGRMRKDTSRDLKTNPKNIGYHTSTALATLREVLADWE